MTSSATKRILSLAVLISAELIYARPVRAQGPPAPVPLRFEVASVHPRPAGDGEPSERKVLPGGRFVATATTARTYLRMTFGNVDIRLPNGASWVDSSTFDIDATLAGHVDITKPEQIQAPLQTLLEERFGLKFHKEKKESSIYWLVLDKPGKPGPDLKLSAADAKQNMSNSSDGNKAQMTVSRVSTADIAAILTRQAGRPIEDHTGLIANYDFHIEWSPDLSNDATLPSLFTVLKERLGFKLQSMKGTTDQIVIDSITRPSEN